MSRIFGPVRQLGYVVRDIEEAMAHWTSRLGVGPFHYFADLPVSEVRYRGEPTEIRIAAAVANDGDIQIRLIQQTNDAPSHYLDHLDRHGEVLHHTAAWASNYDGVVRRVLQAGWVPLQTARVSGNRQALFETQGDFPPTTVGIVDVSGLTGRFNEKVKLASEEWDGSEPIIRYGQRDDVPV